MLTVTMKYFTLRLKGEGYKAAGGGSSLLLEGSMQIGCPTEHTELSQPKV
jgi:hypothetical protein